MIGQKLRMPYVLGRLLYKSVGGPIFKERLDARVKKVDEIVLLASVLFNDFLIQSKVIGSRRERISPGKHCRFALPCAVPRVPGNKGLQKRRSASRSADHKYMPFGGRLRSPSPEHILDDVSRISQIRPERVLQVVFEVIKLHLT
jgi:hypothetical protein